MMMILLQHVSGSVLVISCWNIGLLERRVEKFTQILQQLPLFLSQGSIELMISYPTVHSASHLSTASLKFIFGHQTVSYDSMHCTFSLMWVKIMPSWLRSRRILVSIVVVLIDAGNRCVLMPRVTGDGKSQTVKLLLYCLINIIVKIT